MKKNIIIYAALALLVCVMPLSRLDAMHSWALKSWTHFEVLTYIQAPLNASDHHQEEWYAYLILDIGPSYSYYISKKTSFSVNMTVSTIVVPEIAFPGIGQSTDVFYADYESDESYSGSLDLCEKSAMQNFIRGELFTTINRRLTSHITGFIGFKYASTYTSGEYNIVSFSDSESDNETDVTDTTQYYFTTDSYGGGGGFATNAHMFGNLFFLTSFSYTYMFSNANFSYGSESEQGYYFSHEPMGKLSFAHFFPSIKSTIEIGAQGKLMVYDNVLDSSADRFQKIGDEFITFNVGPVINFTMVFQ